MVLGKGIGKYGKKIAFRTQNRFQEVECMKMVSKLENGLQKGLIECFGACMV